MYDMYHCMWMLKLAGIEATEHLLKKQPHTTTAAFGDAPRPEPNCQMCISCSPSCTCMMLHCLPPYIAPHSVRRRSTSLSLLMDQPLLAEQWAFPPQGAAISGGVSGN